MALKSNKSYNKFLYNYTFLLILLVIGFILYY